MAEGRRTVCAPVCTEEQLAAMTPEHWRPGLDAERKNGCSGYNRSDAEEFERGTAPILSSKIGGIGRRLRVNNGFVHGLHPRLSDQRELLTEPVRPTEARACGA